MFLRENMCVFKPESGISQSGGCRVLKKSNILPPQQSIPFKHTNSRYIFNKDYPTNPNSFGEKLRRCRMDAGLQIKELAITMLYTFLETIEKGGYGGGE